MATLLVESEFKYAYVISRRHDKQGRNPTLDGVDFTADSGILATPYQHFPLERASFSLASSSFDYRFKTWTLDLTPYDQSIAAHERILGD